MEFPTTGKFGTVAYFAQKKNVERLSYEGRHRDYDELLFPKLSYRM